MPINFGLIIPYALGIIALFLLARMTKAPLKIISKLIFNTLIGCIVLLVINLIGGAFKFHIPVNIYSSLITGFLGVPGLILLVIIKYM